ncbi:GH17598 [Drosophila grimshawi]|uniref:GH17598 n=1 Tax=Drosophila grimshawi TaxID=7222 RepID=B4JXB4_DROGR|nr:GH17598 [Drosophila grimshawi]
MSQNLITASAPVEMRMQMRMRRGDGSGQWLMRAMLMALWVFAGSDLLPMAAAGSCREAQLCCNGRDSSCVVQKAPVNAIIEDLSDKPCYCDHACLKLGDCCDDFKDHCGDIVKPERL